MINQENISVQEEKPFVEWMENDDVRHVVLDLYNQMPDENKKHFKPPYVFFDYSRPPPFYQCIDAIIGRLISSGKSYAPFVWKPLPGQAHFIAGLVCKQEEDFVVILFDSCGPKKLIDLYNLKMEYKNHDNTIRILIASKIIQSAEKDGGRLVSCGYFVIMFVDFCLKNPAWIKETAAKKGSLHFSLPKKIQKYSEYSQKEYQESILKLADDIKKKLNSFSKEYKEELQYHDVELNKDIWEVYNKTREERKTEVEDSETDDSETDDSEIDDSEIDDSEIEESHFAPLFEEQNSSVIKINKDQFFNDSTISHSENIASKDTPSDEEKNHGQEQIESRSILSLDNKQNVGSQSAPISSEVDSSSDTGKVSNPQINQNIQPIAKEKISFTARGSAEEAILQTNPNQKLEKSIDLLKKHYYSSLEVSLCRFLQINKQQSFDQARIEKVLAVYYECSMLVEEFFNHRQELEPEQVKFLRKNIQQTIQKHIYQLEKEESNWEKINPILKEFLAILSVLTIIPAIIISCKTPGFKQAFFGKSILNEVKTALTDIKSIPENPPGYSWPKNS